MGSLNLSHFGVIVFLEWFHITCWGFSTLSGGAVAQSVEHESPGEEVLGSPL